MNSLNNHSNVSDGTDLSVTLSEKSLADIILNFLGRKEKLTYTNEDCFFVLRLNDIEQFYYLLNAKIEKENNVKIDHFSVTIIYNDNTSREISGINSLGSFMETRDVVPTSVILTWNILIKYPKAKNIENQNIHVTFSKKSTNKEKDSYIYLSINHTNQAWGIEVLNLFKDKIADVLVKPSKQYVIAKKLKNFLDSKGYSFIFIMLMMLTIFSMPVIDVYHYNSGGEEVYKVVYAYNKTHNKEEKDIMLFAANFLSGKYIKKTLEDKIINDAENISVLQDIAKAKDKKADTAVIKFILQLCVIVFFGFFIDFYLKKSIEYHGYANFILINKRSENEYNDFKYNKNKVEYYSITSLFIAVMCGIIASYIYTLLI